MSTTPDMDLTLPGIEGSSSPTPGPSWAADLNENFTIIDGHNHSSGSGAQINPSGIDINAALPFNDFPATELGWLNVPVIASGTAGSMAGPHGAPTVVPTAVDSIFTDGTDLWYKDGNGNYIQITKNGSLANTVVGTTLVNVTIASANWGQTDINHASSPYTLLSTDFMLVCDPTAGAITINLIASATAGKKRIEVKDLTGQAGTHNITVTANGSDTIDGNASYVLTSGYQAIVLTSDGNGHWMAS
jgi:hypothetical protein